MKILGVIPARYASTRFPGKPLVTIGGITMIERVFNQCRKAKLSDVVVATDDARIYNHVQNFGRAVMTASHHPSGTDRCHEVLQKIDSTYHYVVNIQGDEPFIDPAQINQLIALLDGQTNIATLVKKLNNAEQLFNANVVKAVRGQNGKALYFSRSPVPHMRGVPEQGWITKGEFYKHIGMYAYRTDVLGEIAKLAPSPLEKTEALEQLRWLENGYEIQTAITETETIGIDTPEDLITAEAYLKTLSLQ